ncbi:DUF305 domain-containing protein [Arthrobacter sp. UYCo732]|uniref:DUF305 domain-containing protein n=1 Tax=Arthrobacter sp. UYCo732 TaxID=3156336 RepID=UPI00339A002C
MLSIIPFRYLALFTGVVVAILLVLAFNVGRATATPAPPSEVSADAGFARDMQTHHTQAVEMSMLILERSTDPDIRSLAYDLALTQQQQNGQMFAWLRGWGLQQTSSGDSMAWMHASGHDTHDVANTQQKTTEPMPGLASADDMDRLRKATGQDADTIFLTLMISHHQGGIAMAEAAQQRATTETVRTFTTKMIAAQTAEITAMQKMLAG